MKRKIFISATKSSLLDIPWNLLEEKSITLSSRILKNIMSGSLTDWPQEFKELINYQESVILTGPSNGWWKY